ILGLPFTAATEQLLGIGLPTICGGLNENGSHRPIGHGMIRMSGLVGGNVSLGAGFSVSDVQARPSALFSC
ncbi:mCG141322, partial [Mus musculus]